MFLYKCIGFTYITDNIVSFINKCSYFENKSQILKCLNKKYMYEKICNITNYNCECIENNIIYNNSIYDFKYYVLIIYLSLITISMCCCYKKYIKIRYLEIENDEYSTTDYIINENDTLPKYNEIEKINMNINIKEKNPPKYDEIV